jgi:hypothetical protein
VWDVLQALRQVWRAFTRMYVLKQTLAVPFGCGCMHVLQLLLLLVFIGAYDAGKRDDRPIHPHKQQQHVFLFC